MPVWRPRSDWLHEAVASALDESACEVELIVVDDGNEQPVAELLVDVGDPPSNGGPSTAPHTDNILRLQASGITQGTDSTHYSPANNVTRFSV